jgi:general secretion pathway protein G
MTALLNPPTEARDWQGPYLEKNIPLDPWGNEYVYQYPGRHNLNGFDLMSNGPDSRAGTEDDITNWDVDYR